MVAAAAAALLAGAGLPLEPRPQDATSDIDASPHPIPADGEVYRINLFDLSYIRGNAGLTALDDVLELRFALGRTDAGWVAPRDGVEIVDTSIAELNALGEQLYFASALQTIFQRISQHFIEDLGLIGIFVAPDRRDIDSGGADQRGGGQYALRVQITVAMAAEIRTIASGDRIPDEGRIDNPLHDRIRDNAPIIPLGSGAPEARALLHRDLIDRYLFHLGRHQGRVVDMSIAPTEDEGLVEVDLHITENKPLTLYAQVSNTGTSQTSEWRQRFGFFHTQLTNNDDILHVDYSTAGFDESHAVTASYDAPFENDRIRWRVQGDWSQYTAADVGRAGSSFSGRSWGAEVEVAANVHQDRQLFVDLFAGLRFENDRVSNTAAAIRGEADFLLPRAGVRVERQLDWVMSQAEVALEFQPLSVDAANLAGLGRTMADDTWVVLQFEAAHAVYLEPLLNRTAWEDPTSPDSSTLAHELLARLQGQYAFDNRLVPSHQAVIGGLYTVRGYPTAVVAGDSMIVGTLEYRFHLPRALGIESEPQSLFGRPFRRAPQYVYGTPDWDLVLKAFIDAGHTWTNNALFFEDDHTLLGAGVGIELLYRRNLHLHLDFGVALRDIPGLVEAGDTELHFVGTIYF